MNHSENNLVRNENRSDDRQEPNLFNNSLSLDQLKDKTDDTEKPPQDDFFKDFDNLVTTQTDLGFEYFADENKLYNDIRYFQKPEPSEHDKDKDKDKDSDRDRDSDRDKHRDSDRDKDKHTDKYTDKEKDYIHPSQYGPSVGSGGPTAPVDKYSLDSDEPEFKSKEELKHAKLQMLRKLAQLAQNGVKLTQDYNMASDLNAMRFEYEYHKGIRDRHMGIKWLSNILMNICYGLEKGNEYFDPFGFKLKGWSEQMNEDVDEYYDVLGELHDKYFKEGKTIPPEIKLIMMVSGSAIRFHLSHAMLNSGPDIETTLRDNPALAEKLRQNAINDRVKEQYQKQRTAFSNAQEKQHEMARQKVNDIHQLRKDEENYMKMQNEIENKKRQLDDLQAQLAAQRSDTHSMYDNQQQMAPPQVPAYLRNRFPQEPINSNQQMAEAFRQQQIINQKKIMEQQELMKRMQLQNMMNQSMNGSNINVNPNIDQLIDAKFNDTASRVSGGSTLDSNDLNDSEKSKISSRRRRKKKENIRINV